MSLIFHRSFMERASERRARARGAELRCLVALLLAAGCSSASTPVPRDQGTTNLDAGNVVSSDGAADLAIDAASPLTTASACFGDLTGAVAGPNYDQFNPLVGAHCAGTRHQVFTGIEKLVFLGDSVTTGTPPTPEDQFYRSRVAAQVKQRFGAVEVQDCSNWGARTDDLLDGKKQIAKCFPTGVEAKRTLVVMTIGGNDLAAWAQDQLTLAQAMTEAQKAADLLRAGVVWLKDPAHFPNGSYVIVGSPYEYTDTSGDLRSCPAAAVAGIPANWLEGAPAVVMFQEQFMKIAVETHTDLIFLLEQFCGHGYRHNDSALQCYRGPGTDLWFDFTCIHPTPAAHAKIAEFVMSVIDG